MHPSAPPRIRFLAASALLGAATSAPIAAQTSPLAAAAFDRAPRAASGRYTVSTLLKELAVQSGKPLEADSRLAGFPLIVGFGRRPIRQVLDAVARTADGRWELRRGTITLAPIPGVTAQEQALRDADTRRAMAGAMVRVASLVELSRRSEGELRTLVQNHETERRRRRALRPEAAAEERKLPAWAAFDRNAPLAEGAATLLRPGVRAWVQLLSTLSDRQRQSLLSQGALIFGSQPTSGALPLPAATAELLTADLHRKPIVPDGSPLKDEPARPDGFEARRAQAEAEAAAKGPSAFAVRIQWKTSLSGAVLSGELVGEGRVSGGPRAGAVLPPQTLGRGVALFAAGHKLGSEPLAGEEGAIQAPAHPSSGGPDSDWLNRSLPQIASSLDRDLISDGFRGQRLTLPPRLPAEITRLTLIRTLVEPNADWDMVDGVLVLRRLGRHWLRDRHAPQELVMEASRMMPAPGPLSETAAGLLATRLPDSQMESFRLGLAGEGIRLDGLELLRSGRPLLRFLSALGAQQRTALLDGSPLLSTRLSPGAARALNEALTVEFGTSVDLRKESVQLSLSRGARQPTPALGGRLSPPRLVNPQRAATRIQLTLVLTQRSGGARRLSAMLPTVVKSSDTN